MKTPPLLLFATLLFWGWESDLLWYGAIAGALVEFSRVSRTRWELEDVDFNRIFSLCVLVIVGVAAYVFTTNDDGGGFSGMFQGGARGLRQATQSSTLATTSVFRWLPLILFPFVVAQVYNLRPTVPVTAVSLVLRIRRRRGEKALAGRYVDISYAYFIICVFAAGIHANHATYSYFWGQVVLLLWALRALRSRRFGFKIWAAGLVAVVLVGFLAQIGLNQLIRVVQEFDGELIARFFHSRTDPMQSVTAIGQIGELKLSPRIVIRLEPERTGVVPNYLREASYWTYTPFGRTWSASGQRNDFDNISHARGNESLFPLLSGKTNLTKVSIACYLEGRSRLSGQPVGLLPLPPGCAQLEKLPAYVLQMNKTGSLLATGPGLMIFDAAYGTGATIDSPPGSGTNRFDLSVPTNELPALLKVIAEMNLTNADDAGKLQAAQAFFARNFSYSTWQGLDKRPSPGVTPLTRFLLTSRTGHCEYFATATVLLLRELGIPARYAVGYAVHEASGSGYVVRERDAHAWCLVWNRQRQTWEDFDTTPASWVAMEGGNTRFRDALSDVRSWLVFQFEKLLWQQTNLRQYVFWTISPVMAVLLYYILFQRRARTRTSKYADAAAPPDWPGLDSAFYRLEKSLAGRGLPRQPQEPLSEWLVRVLAEPAMAPWRTPLRELLRLHYRYRFDPIGLTPAEKAAFTQNTEAILDALANAGPRHADDHLVAK